MSQRDYPIWFRQALSRRFDEQANTSVKQHDIDSARKKFDKIMEELRERMEAAVFLKILELEEMINHQHTDEKEWLYVEGVKDGMRIMGSVNNFV
jgi:hypothetical protein